MNETNDQQDVVLANLPAGQTERRIAFAIALTLLTIGAIAVPFGRVPLPQSYAWAPITDTIVFIADLITWFLLISQFNIVRTRALLALASGYFYAGVMIVPHLLTYPHVFTPTGLLGAGVQTAAWIGKFWMLGYPLAVIFYAVMKKKPGAVIVHGSTRTAVAVSVAIVIPIALALTWLATAGEPYLPRLFLTTSESTASLRYVSALLSLPSLIALLLIWFRGRSVLDLWLTVVMCASTGHEIGQINTAGRFCLAYYVTRFLFVVSSSLLLVVLLRETMTLYGRLAVSLIALRRLTAEKLQRSEAYLSEAQRLSHTGSFGWSVPGGDIHWSEETFRILEFDPATQPMLERIFERTHPDDQQFVRQVIDSAALGRQHVDFELRLLMPGGSVKYVHVVAHPSESESGDLEFVGAVTDVSEHKRAEAERERLHQVEADLAHMNRVSMMGELTASLAHEIKQPITAAAANAKTSLRWLQRETPDVEKAREALARIVKDVIRAADMIDRTRSLYRRGAPKLELVNLNEFIREMVLLLREKAIQYSIPIRAELDEALPTITADPVQMQQVLMNLMLNGVEAMKDTGGELTIGSKETEDRKILISVRDLGGGLPVENTERIFDPFFTTKAQGTGLGLSICRRIIESHGGKLWASANPGRGATFYFTLQTHPLTETPLDTQSPEV